MQKTETAVATFHLQKPLMRAILPTFVLGLLFSLLSCRPAGPEEIPLPTQICVKTSHHGQPIPNATIYIKYRSDTFPGYEQPPSYFDASFQTGADARGCLASVPEGRHWLIAFGYDSLYFPNHVYGSMMLDISIPYHAKVDTTFYVSE